jgi:hypothetical protein
LPTSNFLRQFLDHFHLQPHHIGANAMMTLSAFATLCEVYLGIWPSVDLFRWILYFKTQMADSILVTCGAASFYARRTAGFPKLMGKESCKKWQSLLGEPLSVAHQGCATHIRPQITFICRARISAPRKM